jgi:hypothetical protein
MGDVIFNPQPTPNPNAYKFTASRTIHDGPTKSFYTAAAAAADPVAAKLFALPGVTGVMIVGDFCSVNQDGSREWRELIPEIQQILEGSFRGGAL